ncbi:MAG: hypothetical protein HC848_04645 [Limnobacter sp.]|nr:hypothetical protein [Limnobacter sp.]
MNWLCAWRCLLSLGPEGGGPLQAPDEKPRSGLSGDPALGVYSLPTEGVPPPAARQSPPNHKGLLLVVAALCLGAVTPWFFKNHGFILSDAVFLFLVLLVFAMAGLMAYGFAGETLHGLHLPASFCILMIAALNGVAVFTLIEHSEMPASCLHPLFTPIFWATRVACGILLLASALLVFLRTWLNLRNRCTLALELFVFLPFLGILPLWFANPKWSVAFILLGLHN